MYVIFPLIFSNCKGPYNTTEPVNELLILYYKQTKFSDFKCQHFVVTNVSKRPRP